jgi:hypothetical protein
MRKGLLNLLVLAAALAFLLASIPIASAHWTGNERRTVAQCEKLDSKGKVKACIRCVQKTPPHHYHPLNPKGQRCRPNNGKP